MKRNKSNARSRRANKKGGPKRSTYRRKVEFLFKRGKRILWGFQVPEPKPGK